jgi:CRISPR/Cas system endoribonuclease Cas6 (RAMP superfamily)
MKTTHIILITALAITLSPILVGALQRGFGEGGSVISDGGKPGITDLSYTDGEFTSTLQYDFTNNYWYTVVSTND